MNSGSINAILLDLNLSGSERGLDFLAAAHHQYPDVPVLILTAEETFEKRIEAARLGSRYFLQQPIPPDQVLAAVAQVLQQINRSVARLLVVDDDPALLRLLSTLLEPCGYQVTLLSDPQKFWQTLEQTMPDLLILDDELTGLNLRRKAQQDLTQLIRLAQRQQQPFCLALLDLDNFKQVNDRYGHHTGDYVLNYFGKLLRQSFRQEDILGRWGGEEFIIGMYGITKQDGLKRLQEVLDQLNRYVFLANNHEESFRVTFSGGIVQLPNDGADLKTLYFYADQALYEAKAAGRNRIFARGISEINR